VRILIAGAGVIGSVYGARLLQAGHDVVMLARGARLTDLQREGLVVEDAQSAQRTVLAVSAVTERLREVIEKPVRFGFPGVGGVRAGAVIRFVLIDQQKTMLGELEDEASIRARRVQSVFVQAGLPTRITRHVEQWLQAHTAFVVPIAFALYRCDTNAAQLASDPISLRLMVRATQQAFRALQATGNSEIPTNLKVLYLRMPEAFAVRYWRRALAGPRGELWFAAHSRAAPEEMASLAAELLATIHRTGRPAADLDALMSVGQ
jgi:2-dehydropantoate 2-reductase